MHRIRRGGADLRALADREGAAERAAGGLGEQSRPSRGRRRRRRAALHRVRVAGSETSNCRAGGLIHAGGDGDLQKLAGIGDLFVRVTVMLFGTW